MTHAKFKSRVTSTVITIKKHKTLAACAATAAITYRVTNHFAIKGAYGSVAELVYEYGREAGQHDVFTMMVNDYLAHKDLTEEFMHFATPKA